MCHTNSVAWVGTRCGHLACVRRCCSLEDGVPFLLPAARPALHAPSIKWSLLDKFSPRCPSYGSAALVRAECCETSKWQELGASKWSTGRRAGYRVVGIATYVHLLAWKLGAFACGRIESSVPDDLHHHSSLFSFRTCVSRPFPSAFSKGSQEGSRACTTPRHALENQLPPLGTDRYSLYVNSRSLHPLAPSISLP